MGLTLQSYCGDGMMGPSNLLQGRVWMLSKKELFLHTFIPQVPSVFRWQGWMKTHLHTTQHTTPGSSGIPEPLLCQQVVKSLEVKVPRCWYGHRIDVRFSTGVFRWEKGPLWVWPPNSCPCLMGSFWPPWNLEKTLWGMKTLQKTETEKKFQRTLIPPAPPQKRDHQHLQ